MTQSKKKIALIYGGRGSEHQVSLCSAEYVMSQLSREKYELFPILIEKDGSWLYGGEQTFPVGYRGLSGFAVCGKILPVDCAIPLLHGDYGEDGRVQGALDTAGIAYVGADTLAGAVCMDKAYTRAVAGSIGIPTARGVLIPRGSELADIEAAAEEIGYPVFIKPTRQGSSIGASAVKDKGELHSAYVNAAIHGGVLIEELVTDKREIEVGVLSLKRGRIISPPGEVLCDGFYDYAKKYGGTTVTVCPAELDGDMSSCVRNYARRLAEALDLSGPARIDFFLSGKRLLFNEINTMPGFTRDSLYPRLMRAAGIGTSALFDLLIEDATE